MSRKTIVSFLSLVVVAIIVLGNSQSLFSGLGKVRTGVPQTAAVYSVVPNEPVTLITEPKDGVDPVLARINAAKASVDLVIYELEDQRVEGALLAAKNRGVAVRVLLNGGLYGKGSSANEAAYSYLQAHSVPVEWTPSYFALTHQKTLIVDAGVSDADALIMTFNLTPKYYATSRDFAIDDPDVRDVAAIEQAFTDDWNGTKDTPSNGDDLVWSPGSKSELLAMISAAKKSLLVYNEELGDQDVIAAFQQAASHGVSVQILMTDQAKWHDGFSAITDAGGQVRTYAQNAPLYIHAKMILVDGQQVFLGSENFSTPSMSSNRELGLLVSNPTVIQQLTDTFTKDWQGAEVWK